MNTSTTSTGYGPRHRLMFDGEETRYELWEVKFLGYMRLQKLHDVILAKEEESTPPSAELNSNAFAELVQFLDDRSLSLVIRDARDDGREALKILRGHYLGIGKPRIISLYTELTSLQLGGMESVTDFTIRAETAANSLKTAGETVSDSLLIAMVLKGLPSNFKTFSAIVTQKEKQMCFVEFKAALRSFEESERCHTSSSSKDSIMKIDSNIVTCYKCGKSGHKSFECKFDTPTFCDELPETHEYDYEPTDSYVDEKAIVSPSDHEGGELIDDHLDERQETIQSLPLEENASDENNQVRLNDELVSSIDQGICVLVGISKNDSKKDMEYIVRKVLNLRVFDDDKGKRWACNVKDKNLEILCVSQFTLYAVMKGNKPDYHLAMGGDQSKTFYEEFLSELRKNYRSELVKDGRFGAYMQVSLQNDGPVTIQLESPDNKDEQKKS
ncbi:D-aminoacyl-tRNA deacylase 1 [Nymphon striatum]|nr:D-aminoacyl-tRNA deacylase 1 [Nymphon striatum]